MSGDAGGMELWAIVPELVLAGAVLVLLPLGSFLPAARKGLATGAAMVGLAAAGAASARMLGWPAQPVFQGTYAVDPLAVFVKLLAVLATAITLLATHGHFRGHPQEGVVPAVLLLSALGIAGLGASQDLALIALFLVLSTVGSYLLVGVAKEDRRATEGALKLFLFSAVAGVVMLYGMTLLFGLAGTLRLPELGLRLPGAPAAAVLVAGALVLVGYGYKITLVPFHSWAPDAYQGAPTPVAGFLSVAPKAAGLAVLLRTLVVAFPGFRAEWPVVIAALAAITMTLGTVLALRQASVKRLLAYSSIGQVGYMLAGVAAAGLDPLAVPAVLFYLAVYLFMNLGAFLAVEGIEHRTGSDDVAALAGLGRSLPLSAAILTLSVLSLAGFPPLGGFVGKTMLLGAALGAGWAWLAAVMAANTALSLFAYVRIIEPLYLEPGASADVGHPREPRMLRVALVVVGVGLLASGIVPDPWLTLAERSARLWPG